MNKQMKIIERSSGWWVVNDSGPVEGPFDTEEEAAMWINEDRE